MESISLFFGVIILVFAALQIILFFKLWRMTNDVRGIYEMIYNHINGTSEPPFASPDDTLEVADVAVCAIVETTSGDTDQASESEPIEVKYLVSVWKCPNCGSVNHYRTDGVAVCDKCGFDLHK